MSVELTDQEAALVAKYVTMLHLTFERLGHRGVEREAALAATDHDPERFVAWAYGMAKLIRADGERDIAAGMIAVCDQYERELRGSEDEATA